jgi:hypothetical protein
MKQYNNAINFSASWSNLKYRKVNSIGSVNNNVNKVTDNNEEINKIYITEY